MCYFFTGKIYILDSSKLSLIIKLIMNTVLEYLTVDYIVVFTPYDYVPVMFFGSSWHKFGDRPIVLKFCICCQLPYPDKSPNFKLVA